VNSIDVSDSERADARLSAETIHRAGAAQHERREFVVSFDYPPIPVRCFDWSAIDRNTYDGAPDSRQQVGRGPTAEAALRDLLDILEEDAERADDEAIATLDGLEVHQHNAAGQA